MLNIAIDGPAGAGKSTLAKGLAKALGIYYLDTGAMYRAFAWDVLRLGGDASSRESVEELIDRVSVDVEFDNREQKVYADGIDVTGLIRTPEISAASSAVAVFPAVRLKLVQTQREIAKRYNVVMDGRDIGTFVLPDAKFKFFVTAGAAVRALRRGLELEERGVKVDFAKLEQEITLRDKNDSTREFAPLVKADDAVLIDTSGMDAAQALEYVLHIIKRDGNA